MSLSVSSATFAPVTAESAIFASVTAFAAIFASVTAPSAIFLAFTAAVSSFFLVIALDLMSSVSIFVAAHAVPESATAKAMSPSTNRVWGVETVAPSALSSSVVADAVL